MAGPREAVRARQRARIHGGTKAREIGCGSTSAPVRSSCTGGPGSARFSSQCQSASSRRRPRAVRRRLFDARNVIRNPLALTPVATAVLGVLYGGTTAAASNSDAIVDGGGLDPITVTATRRSVSAQALPLSITAISGSALASAGIDDIAKLADDLAGVDFTDKGPFSGVAGANLIIRGLNSEATAWLPAAASPVVPPVAIYVDDTPLYVNLRLQDLERVEVLRAPQGTLYGSGSLGGTIRFVQNAPDPTAFDAKATVGVSDTEHTSEPNEDATGMLNLPLSETVALRVNAGWSYDAGFINQPNLYRLDASGVPIARQPGNLFSAPETYARDHTNDYQYRSARAALLWKPNDAFRAQLAYYYQLDTAGGFPYIATSEAAYSQPISSANLPAGNFDPPALTQLYSAPVPAGVDRLSNADNGPDITHDRVDLVALDLSADLGFATLSSSSSWARHVNRSTVDETGEYLNFSFAQDRSEERRVGKE